MSELTDLFAILVEKYQITRGSIILISSATNLAVVGLDAYTDTTVDTVKKIKTILGVTVEVPPIPESSLSLTEAVFDLCTYVAEGHEVIPF
jgi:hypothetical protein